MDLTNERNRCLEVTQDGERPADPDTAALALTLIGFAVSAFAERYWQPAIFADANGQVEVVFQSRGRRLSLFVDGQAQSINAVCYDRSGKSLTEERCVAASEMDELRPALSWGLGETNTVISAG